VRPRQLSCGQLDCLALLPFGIEDFNVEVSPISRNGRQIGLSTRSLCWTGFGIRCDSRYRASSAQCHIRRRVSLVALPNVLTVVMTPSVPIPKALSGWRQALMTVSPGRSER
jgi:hypothetical protein